MKSFAQLAFILLFASAPSIADEVFDLLITPDEYILGDAHLKSLEEFSSELAKVSPKKLHIKLQQGVTYDEVAGALKVVQKQGNISIGFVANKSSP